MPRNLFIYADPTFLEGEFNWEGPDTFRFRDSMVSDAIAGFNAFGRSLHAELPPAEREILSPRGFFQEEELPRLDPAELRRVLMKLFDLIARRTFEGEDEIANLEVFQNVRLEIAGAVLICDRAIERGCGVYWALW